MTFPPKAWMLDTLPDLGPGAARGQMIGIKPPKITATVIATARFIIASRTAATVIGSASACFRNT